MSFPGLSSAYVRVRTSTNYSIVQDAAAMLPLDASREPLRYRDSEHASRWVADSWAASVERAARELSNLVTIHDNGGTASSPAKIKRAARELLRLLGED